MTYITLANAQSIIPGTLLRALGTMDGIKAFALVLEKPWLDGTVMNTDDNFNLRCNCFYLPGFMPVKGLRHQEGRKILKINMNFCVHDGFTVPTCVGWEIVSDID